MFLTPAAAASSPQLILATHNPSLRITRRKGSRQPSLFLVAPQHSHDANLWRRSNNSFLARLSRALISLLGSCERHP